MIRFKNIGEFVIGPLKAPGSATTATTFVDFTLAPFTGYITSIIGYFGQMGTDGTGSPTQDVQVDIKKNGSSIFSAKLAWTHAEQLGTANTPIAADSFTLSTNPTLVNKGDKLDVSVAQILNGTGPTQPTDLAVYIGMAPQVGQDSPSGTLLNQLTPNL